MADDIDFEVMGPQDTQEISYDLDDDLTTPLTSTSREYVRSYEMPLSPLRRFRTSVECFEHIFVSVISHSERTALELLYH
jgi:hypothetical protein